ncbi:FAS1-like dehydratase domain-containing protein [Sphingomonas soli]|uniref:FAS1-like dehydratase domain-containing protein n=1 Tax=Sphingomonas soli TaxID=266127 RepID=UPI0008329BAA|nr:MaoC family dehydratase N-terminal domain-containing protein [Sphingomonas soli]
MTAIDPAELLELRAAIGRQETQVAILETESLRRYALAIGADPDVERCQPQLAHWAFFLPAVRDSEIGADGHPQRGGFLPAVKLPRRMFAAADMTFHAPLQLGQPAEMTGTIADVAHKSGRSGDLLFVEVDRVVTQDGLPRVSERQSYVYRGDSGPAPMPAPSADPIEGELWHPDEVNLFRFSAATFNGHRIHYDLPYAKAEEGYPALVIHGPFTASKLAELAGRLRPLAGFSFRAQAPLFLGQPVRLQTSADTFRAIRADGMIAMTALPIWSK